MASVNGGSSGMAGRAAMKEFRDWGGGERCRFEC